MRPVESRVLPGAMLANPVATCFAARFNLPGWLARLLCALAMCGGRLA